MLGFAPLGGLALGASPSSDTVGQADGSSTAEALGSSAALRMMSDPTARIVYTAELHPWVLRAS